VVKYISSRDTTNDLSADSAGHQGKVNIYSEEKIKTTLWKGEFQYSHHKTNEFSGFCIKNIYFQLEETQCEFRRNRSTQNHIFTLRQISEKITEFGKEAHLCFTDI
jgi:hypothetical protein